MRLKNIIALAAVCALTASFFPAPAAEKEKTPDGGTEIVVTFGGDCTLGSEDQFWQDETSFIRHIERYGKSYPFEKLYPLFSADDVTLLNLEGTFHESTLGKRVKTYCFRAPKSYAEILTLSSVEAVTLGNNHSEDYGKPGFDSTVEALDAVGMPWFVNCAFANKPWVYEKNGVRVGFVGFYIGYWKSNLAQIKASLQTLRDMGCAAIVGVMHGGVEYSQKHDSMQTRMAETCLDMGATLVIGHHPHVLQGVERREHATIVYSLGNLAFGGNKRVKAMADTGLIVSARFLFDKKGVYTGHQLTLHPIHPSSTGTMVNNFRPILAEGAEAVRAMDIIQADTAFRLEPYVEGEGAVQTFVKAPPPPAPPPDPMELLVTIETK